MTLFAVVVAAVAVGNLNSLLVVAVVPAVVAVVAVVAGKSLWEHPGSNSVEEPDFEIEIHRTAVADTFDHSMVADQLPRRLDA